MYLLGDSPGRFLLQATTFFLKFWQLKTEMKHTLNENSIHAVQCNQEIKLLIVFVLFIHTPFIGSHNTTPEEGSWGYPYVKISSSPYRLLTHHVCPGKAGHTNVVYVPYSFRTVVWVLSFYVPQEPDEWKYCKMQPTVFVLIKED